MRLVSVIFKNKIVQIVCFGFLALTLLFSVIAMLLFTAIEHTKNPEQERLAPVLQQQREDIARFYKNMND